MKPSVTRKTAGYKPALFIAGTFLFTWLCIFALESTYIFAYEMPDPLVTLLDFAKSASPLIVALILFRKRLAEKGFLAGYVFGERKRGLNYTVVALIFALQFLTFYLFRPAQASITVPAFLTVFLGQLLFGGGMEEGGWRGYLLPALMERMPVLLASTVTGIVWALWHLPYFFISSSSQYGSNFFGYMFVTVMLGYLLSAIYMLTKSVLLCTLFHAFTNASVMTLQADMGNHGLMVMFALISVSAAILCQVAVSREKKRAASLEV